MSSGADQLRALADQISVRDALAGMSGPQIARTFGVSRAAGWRAATGRTANPAFARTDAFRDFRAAQAMRQRADRGQLATPPMKVAVRYLRRGEGMRDLPALELAEPYLIARRMEEGRWDEAEAALSAQLTNAYGDLEGRDRLADALDIADYEGELFE